MQYANGSSRVEMVKIGDQKIVPLIIANSSNSPDGKWLAYASEESGTWEIYVTSFPSPAGKLQLSQGGGTEPRWRGDGKELFYINSKRMMTAVPISTMPDFSSGSPRELFAVPNRAPISSTDLYSYDVTKDGRRFIVDKYQKPSSLLPLDIILHATK